ncbi:MAG: hypothetical protein KF901_07370 [Myxococcales bacterium]|nr:hypothetical protein [Myxococcales bacterium]
MRDAAPDDAGALRDAGGPARDAGRFDAGRLDAGRFDDVPGPGPVILDEWVPLTPEQAECFGLTEPTCATCHLVPGTDQWVLRPTFAGAPPDGMIVTPRDCP